jgi:predicted lipid-binding transport protein (Tim44 family)
VTRRIAVTLAIGLALVAFEAAARPGGGQGYSGGGSSGGSSGGGGGDGAGLILELLVRLIFAYPAIGIPVALVVAYLWWRHSHHVADVSSDRWSSGGGEEAEAPAPARRARMDRIREVDPGFSAVLFEDFVYALYARVNMARGDAKAMAKLAPYVAEGSRAAMLAREPSGVRIVGVIVGALRVVGVRLPADRGEDSKVRVDLEIEANFTAGETGHYVQELWTLERSATVVSKPPPGPGEAHEFRCPSCGAPFEASDDDTCRYCKREVGEGRFDWTLTHVRLQRQETRPPALTSDVAEQGTDLPTVFDPQVRAQHAALIAEDPGAAPEQLERRLRTIYAELNAAWSALDLRKVRPYVSDSLFNYLAYWITAYREQGLRNVLEQMAISRMQIVKLTRDRHYDAITLRFWASGLDYTVRAADGKRVSGSSSRPRGYSEYWTLIRGTAVRGAPKAAGTCPSCGAPLDRVNMAGTCEYCGGHLTRGEFDWVLSKIEQDDSYAG